MAIAKVYGIQTFVSKEKLEKGWIFLVISMARQWLESTLHTSSLYRVK
jgi:hypothetical protein